ncbi:MAG: tol-pal system protein YbgF [Acidobacteriaceae bacterium]|nr:tol-pal system protein YbgF [Acidobacteriaceae bacterium]
MKFLRAAALLLICSSFSFAVNKDLVQLQRDLEDRINTLQNDVDSKLSELNGLITALQNENRHTADQLAGMQDQVSNGVAKSLTPVAGLGSKVDGMTNEVQALQASIADLSARLERMDAKITDLKNQIQVIQNPPAAPGAAGPQGQASAPPPGMSADQAYTAALRDLQTGKADLAQQEFQQYLQYFPNTELAANAQYYLGEIAYNHADYKGAIDAFDAVLERYPDNPKTPDAHYMKGMALLKANERSRAVQEFRVLVQNYPHTDDARKALQQLHSLGVSAGTPTARRKP